MSLEPTASAETWFGIVRSMQARKTAASIAPVFLIGYGSILDEHINVPSVNAEELDLPWRKTDHLAPGQPTLQLSEHSLDLLLTHWGNPVFLFGRELVLLVALDVSFFLEAQEIFLK